MFGMGTGGPSVLKSPTEVRDELSFRAVAHRVLSPLQSLTSVFGMGTGGPSALKSRTEKGKKRSLKTERSRKQTHYIELYVRTEPLFVEVQALGQLVSVS